MKKIKILILCVTVFVLLVFSTGYCKAAQGEVDYTKGKEYNFIAASGVVLNNPIQLAMTEMNRIITEKTNGRITFTEHHQSVLGSERDLLEQLSQGLVDMVGGGAQVAYNFVPACGVFDLPYLFMSDEHAMAVLNSDIGDEIFAKFEGTGIKPLTWLNSGWRNITSNRELSSPDDMEGMKVRSLENQVYIDMFRALEANPTPMAFPEVYTALQQGTVDGHDNPFVVINNARFDEVQDYIYVTEHTLSLSLLSFSQKVWDSLSEADQQLIQSVASEMMEYSFKENKRVDAESKAAILERGNARIIEVDKSAWANAVREIYPKYEKIYGKEFIDKIVNFDYE